MSRRRFTRPFLAGALLLVPVVLGATGGDRQTLNGPGLPGDRAGLGALDASPDGCLVSFDATVVTAPGGGDDAFELQVADDGRIVRRIPLSAPADGATHQVTGQFRLGGPPATATPGIGLYLPDNDRILDAIDPFGVPCTVVEVPALRGRGFLALGGVLAAAALVTLRRPRRA
jgi:hypothetical protein